jgi:prepilin-type N-terminal cleavage/methylation domain-containing protein
MAPGPKPESRGSATSSSCQLADAAPGFRRQSTCAAPGSRTAFSLVELLVVLAIIGLLATLALPAFKGLGQSNLVTAAHRQMLDDLALARAKAISERTTVYMLFVPPRLASTNNLSARQLTAYALMTRRSVGAQPGVLNPRFLTEWRDLPEGIFVATNKFNTLPNGSPYRPLNGSEYTNSFWVLEKPLNNPFFAGLDASIVPPLGYFYIAFDPRGQLVHFDNKGQVVPQGQDEIIPVCRGSIFLERDAKGVVAPDVIESQAATRSYIRVNWLTGRARVERREVQ